MAYEHILVENEEGVAVLTMDRPEVLNAMNHTLVSELHDAVMAANADDNIGCIVITGAGEKAFSAGGDIHEQREDARNRTEEERDVRSAEHSQFMYDISSSPKPVIGMMNGLAYGGGAVLASCLDIRVGCENTKFRFLAVAYGRINSTWTLTNQVGWPKAKEFLFTARIVEAEEALQTGLLNHLVPADQLRAKTMEMATLIAKNNQASVKGIKQILLKDMTADLQGMWQIEKDYTSVVKGYGVEDAFPEFIARKGRE
ncbi:MAG: enoyl-CoA hydratase/isomerase family protein [Chloroflexi bacterium]|nr:enoyl-CoA hydratase/isomerase family protein [Chloroflexota bacterium]MCI0899052.1 enoyl-CoA hydratase/isomerase family protein [Chloroflexota bacterium]